MGVILLGKTPHKVKYAFYFNKTVNCYVWHAKCTHSSHSKRPWEKMRRVSRGHMQRVEKEIRILGDHHESFPERD